MDKLVKRIEFEDGTCTYDFSNERVGEFLRDHKKGVDSLFERVYELENDPRMEIKGMVEQSDKAYKRLAYVFPTPHHYENGVETSYIKYTCPVCEALGNKHRVSKDDNNCPLCGVNLSWERCCRNQ